MLPTQDKEAQSKITLRIHTIERTIIKMCDETSPINTSWEELSEKWRSHYQMMALDFLSDLEKLGYHKGLPSSIEEAP